MRYFLCQVAVACTALSCAVPFADADPLNYGLVSLSEEASQTITRNEMVLSLSIQEQGSSREKIANIVTNRLNAVLQAAKRHSDFNTTLQSRSAYPITAYENGKRVNKGWQDSASVVIKSKNLAALNQFAASVQSQAAIDNVQYTVSREVIEKEETRLTSQATERFKQRAAQITRDLGGSGYQIVQLNIGNSGNGRYGNNEIADYGSGVGFKMMAASAPAQDSAPGETQINLNINGQIQVLGLH